MTRDFDLIRKIMAEAQSLDPNHGYVKFVYDDEDNRAVLEHCALLVKAGLLDGKIKESDSGIIHEVLVSRITWYGHDFLSASKSNSIWNKAKKQVLNEGISFTFDILVEYLKHEAKQKLGLI